MNRRQAGFSLIEMVVVLTIASIVVAAVSMRWNSTFDNVNYQTVVQEVIQFDNVTRRHAIAHRKPCRMTFDLDKNRIVATRWNFDRPFEIAYELRKPMGLGQVNTRVSKSIPQTLTIDVSPHGTSQTYFMEVKCNNKSRWIVISGGSGQANEYEKKESVSQVFSAFAISGLNSD